MFVHPASFGFAHHASCLPNVYTTFYACSTPSRYAFRQVNRYDFTFICSCLAYGSFPYNLSICNILFILSLQTIQGSLSALEIVRVA